MTFTPTELRLLALSDLAERGTPTGRPRKPFSDERTDRHRANKRRYYDRKCGRPVPEFRPAKPGRPRKKRYGTAIRSTYSTMWDEGIERGWITTAPTPTPNRTIK